MAKIIPSIGIWQDVFYQPVLDMANDELELIEIVRFLVFKEADFFQRLSGPSWSTEASARMLMKRVIRDLIDLLLTHATESEREYCHTTLQYIME